MYRSHILSHNPAAHLQRGTGCIQRNRIAIPCVSMDVHFGQGAADWHLYEAVGPIDFAWLPTY